MAIVNCPECGREISDQAVMCPHCGYPMRGLSGYEYRSERELFGLPLVHIVGGRGFDPVTGRLRVAKGIIAVGPIAFGGLAMGGAAFGIFSFGGVALGLTAFGGAAVGALLAVGGAAIGAVALGGAAIGYYAFGGGVLGVHALGGNAQDPNLVEFFKNWFPHGSGRS
ncbi:MAG: zinc ribbon domain-containing protein [Solirubrobacterales bacterium]